MRKFSDCDYLCLLGVLFFVPLSFDYKGQDAGGGVIQFLLAGTTVGVFAIIIIIFCIKNNILSFFDKFVSGLVVTFALSIVPIFIWDVPFGNYIRVAVPYLLFLMAYIVATYFVRIERVGYLIDVMILGCAISVFVSFLSGLYLSGDVYSARHRILSPVVLCCIVLVLYKIIIEKRGNILYWALLGVSFSVVFASQTRSSLLAAFLIIAAYFFSMRMYSGVIFFLAAIIFIVAGVYFEFFPSELIDGWFGRFGAVDQMGFDLTTETRKAEIYGQYEMLSENIYSIIFGRGWGAQYYWSGESFNLVRSVLGDGFYGDEQFEAGHNFWFYSVFAGGIFGLIFPILLLMRMSNLLFTVVFYRNWPADYFGSIAFSFSVAVAFFANTIGGNPMGPRYSALIYGSLFAIYAVKMKR